MEQSCIVDLASTLGSGLLSALLGAAFGALVAHRLATNKERKNIFEHRYSSATKAQICLIEQFNFIKNFREQNLDPFRGDGAAVELIRRVNTPLNRKIVDISELSFLLETEDPNLLLDISVMERNYLSTLDSLEEFNAFKKRLESRAIDYDAETKSATLILNEQERDEVIELTENLFKFTDKTESGLKETIEKLRLAIKRSFPKMKTFSAK